MANENTDDDGGTFYIPTSSLSMVLTYRSKINTDISNGTHVILLSYK